MDSPDSLIDWSGCGEVDLHRLDRRSLRPLPHRPPCLCPGRHSPIAARRHPQPGPGQKTLRNPERHRQALPRHPRQGDRGRRPRRRRQIFHARRRPRPAPLLAHAAASREQHRPPRPHPGHIPRTIAHIDSSLPVFSVAPPSSPFAEPSSPIPPSCSATNKTRVARPETAGSPQTPPRSTGSWQPETPHPPAPRSVHPRSQP